MKKRKIQASLKRRTHLSLQRRAAVKRRQRIANRRQLSQWVIFQNSPKKQH